jgi:hypothetical protein
MSFLVSEGCLRGTNSFTCWPCQYTAFFWPSGYCVRTDPRMAAHLALVEASRPDPLSARYLQIWERLTAAKTPVDFETFLTFVELLARRILAPGKEDP